MANTNTLIWATKELCGHLPLVKGFEPVYEWNNDSRSFSDNQLTYEGLPVWESQALLPVGWGHELTPIRIRVASLIEPEIKIDPAKLLSSMGISIQKPAPITRGGNANA